MGSLRIASSIAVLGLCLAVEGADPHTLTVSPPLRRPVPVPAPPWLTVRLARAPPPSGK